MNEENDQELVINDEISDLRPNPDKISFSKKIIIASIIIIIFLAILIITIILLTKSSNDDKFSEKKIAGEIKCLYKIIEISSVTQLLSKEFKNFHW